MHVDQLIARVRSRIATMQTTAEEYEIEAKFHADKALDLRLGVMELNQLITSVQEFVDGEPDETSASAPGSEVAASDAAAAPAGEVSPPASPATILDHGDDTAALIEVPTTSDASVSAQDSALDGVLITTHSAAAPTDETGTASSSEPIPMYSRAGLIGTWVRGDEKAPDPAPAGGAATPPAPTTKAELVSSTIDAHPDWTARQVAEHLGMSIGAVSGHASLLGKKFAPARPKPVSQPPAKAPPPAPPPEDAIAPDETVMDIVQRQTRSIPKGTQFRLRAGRGEGKYLHMSGVGMTAVKAYAWIGTEAHLLKLRQKFPDAVDLVEEVVEKEPAR